MLGSFRLTLVCCLLVLGAVAQCTSAANAQEIPELKPEQRAVVAFDLDLKRVTTSVERLGSKIEQFGSMELEGAFEGVNANSITRLSGAMTLPESVGKLMEMGMGSGLPIEVVFRFEFSDEDDCRILAENVEAGSEEVEIGGKTYWKPGEDSDTPEGLLGHKTSATTFEFGTEAYLVRSGKNLMTAKLEKAWAKLPKDSFRVAADMETPGDFVAEAVEMGAESVGIQERAFIELIDNLASFSLSFDLETKTLLTFEAMGLDESEAEEFGDGLESLVGLATMGGQIVAKQMAEDAPEFAEVSKELLGSLAVKREGLAIRMAVPKPEGFDTAMKSMFEMEEKDLDSAGQMNQFRQLVLATHNYESANRKFPFDNAEDELGWRVRILPFMEQSDLFKRFDMDKGPDSETNSQFADEMPKSMVGDDGKSNVSWIKSKAFTFGMITDGTSNTIMLIENPAGEPWLENGSLTIDQAVEMVSELEDGVQLIAAFYDGSVRRIDNSIKKETLRNLFDPQDGNAVEDY
ncbi:MAG: hypothetical protein ACI814_002213 [Mariniblastus sp.]|jgi:hypothetical protein